MPLELELGPRFTSHSTFTCPISKEVRRPCACTRPFHANACDPAMCMHHVPIAKEVSTPHNLPPPSIRARATCMHLAGEHAAQPADAAAVRPRPRARVAHETRERLARRALQVPLLPRREYDRRRAGPYPVDPYPVGPTGPTGLSSLSAARVAPSKPRLPLAHIVGCSSRRPLLGGARRRRRDA